LAISCSSVERLQKRLLQLRKIPQIPRLVEFDLDVLRFFAGLARTATLVP